MSYYATHRTFDPYYASAQLFNGIIIAVIHRRNTAPWFDEIISDI